MCVCINERVSECINDQLQSELICVAVFICVSKVCVDIVFEMTIHEYVVLCIYFACPFIHMVYVTSVQCPELFDLL